MTKHKQTRSMYRAYDVQDTPHGGHKRTQRRAERAQHTQETRAYMMEALTERYTEQHSTEQRLNY